MKGKKGIARARASQFSQAGAVDAFGIKASLFQFSKGIAMQEWLGEKISNEPSNPRNASSCQSDVVTVARVGDQLGDRRGGNAK